MATAMVITMSITRLEWVSWTASGVVLLAYFCWLCVMMQ
jgi:hypothetical protein